ncbi:MAG TPA: hypothetical protein VGO47_12745 [Chlamydiales bacterium]|nr:hypothetical protein [Chlamydiales bacterium]
MLLDLSNKTKIDLFRKNEHWTWKDDLENTRQDAQWLRKNPARYLAKYLSKGSRKAASDFEYHPSRWWSVDRKTAAEAKAERIRIQTGGWSLNELESISKKWFENTAEFLESIFHFENKRFTGCGGAIAFTDSEQSQALAVWFYSEIEKACESENLANFGFRRIYDQ